MAKFYVQTIVTYWFEGEFETEEDAEAFGWNIDEMNYGEVDEIKVEELPEEDEETDE
jgi:hypothetical protein